LPSPCIFQNFSNIEEDVGTGFIRYLKLQRLSSNTVSHVIRRIKTLRRNVDLWDIEAVENFVQSKRNNGYKNLLLTAYRHWVNYHGFDYHFKPYPASLPIPKIPLEKSIDQLRSYMSHTRYCALLQLVKETGLRAEEAIRLTIDDFDLQHQILTINEPAKNTLCGQYKLSNRLVAMLYPLVHRSKGRLWTAKLPTALSFIRRKKKELARQLNDKDILKVTPLGIRHWKASTEYQKTKDILYVQHVMRHKDIKSTMRYTHLLSFESDEFTCKVASTIEEARNLIESGFEYVTEMDGVKLFRKRK
jgi:integrase